VATKKSHPQWDLNARPFSLEGFTVPRHVHPRHNVVNINNKFSDFHGGHFGFKPYGDIERWCIGGIFYPNFWNSHWTNWH